MPQYTQVCVLIYGQIDWKNIFSNTFSQRPWCLSTNKSQTKTTRSLFFIGEKVCDISLNYILHHARVFDRTCWQRVIWISSYCVGLLERNASQLIFRWKQRDRCVFFTETCFNLISGMLTFCKCRQKEVYKSLGEGGVQKEAWPIVKQIEHVHRTSSFS